MRGTRRAATSRLPARLTSARQSVRYRGLIATALVIAALVGIGAFLGGAFLGTSLHDAKAERIGPSASHPIAASSGVAMQVRSPAVAASSQRAEVVGGSTAGGPLLLEDDAATLESLLQGLPADAASRVSEIVRLSHCATTGGHRWRTPAGVPHALRVVTVDCRPPELGEAGEEAQRRAVRLSEYPLVFVARDNDLSEVELPGFMYQSGQIGSVTTTTDGWPVFHLGGTVYECGEEDKDCQSEGELTVVFRDGKVVELPTAGSAESATH